MHSWPSGNVIREVVSFLPVCISSVLPQTHSDSKISASPRALSVENDFSVNQCLWWKWDFSLCNWYWKPGLLPFSPHFCPTLHGTPHQYCISPNLNKIIQILGFISLLTTDLMIRSVSTILSTSVWALTLSKDTLIVLTKQVPLTIMHSAYLIAKNSRISKKKNV